MQTLLAIVLTLLFGLLVAAITTSSRETLSENPVPEEGSEAPTPPPPSGNLVRLTLYTDWYMRYVENITCWYVNGCAGCIRMRSSLHLLHLCPEKLYTCNTYSRILRIQQHL